MITGLAKLPAAPGVYFFWQGRKLLYIGKATSLKNRAKSYFNNRIGVARGPWIAGMVELVDRVTYIATDSVLEALLLEAELIKTHQPPYNQAAKDDKSFSYVVITKGPWPRVLLWRGRELQTKYKEIKLLAKFGPFPSAIELRAALKIIRKIFPFHDECIPISGRPCFNAQIGLCPGVCAGWINRSDYRRTIKHLVWFFQGKKAMLLKQLTREMQAAAKAQKFEQAAQIKNQLFALRHIQDVALIKREVGEVSGARLEAYDVAHTSGKETVGVMVTSRDGQLDKSGYRRFKLRGRAATRSDDTANLAEILTRRLGHPEWPAPQAIIVDGGRAQINAATRVLKSRGFSSPVLAVVKDEHHRAREIIGPAPLVERYRATILLLNHEAHRFAINFHRQRRGRMV